MQQQSWASLGILYSAMILPLAAESPRLRAPCTELVPSGRAIWLTPAPRNPERLRADSGSSKSVQ